MSVKSVEAMLDRMTIPNRAICLAALSHHDKHYWALCNYVKNYIKRRGKNRCPSPQGMLAEILSEGHTVASCIWEKYHDMPPSEFINQ